MFRPTWPSSSDKHHVWNTAVYSLTGQLPVLAQLFKKFYSVYVFFERSHHLICPEPDESNSHSHKISLMFVLILYCCLPNNFIIVVGSCHLYPVAYRTGTRTNLIILLLSVFSKPGLSVTPDIPRYILNARSYIKIFRHAGVTLSPTIRLR